MLLVPVHGWEILQPVCIDRGHRFPRKAHRVQSFGSAAAGAFADLGHCRTGKVNFDCNAIMRLTRT